MFTPFELIERLLPLIPRPHKHTIHFHGILAPAAGYRSKVVPGAGAPGPPKERPGPERPSPHRLPWADPLRRVFLVDVLAAAEQRQLDLLDHDLGEDTSSRPPRSGGASLAGVVFVSGIGVLVSARQGPAGPGKGRVRGRRSAPSSDKSPLESPILELATCNS